MGCGRGYCMVFRYYGTDDSDTFIILISTMQQLAITDVPPVNVVVVLRLTYSSSIFVFTHVISEQFKGTFI